MTAIINGKYRVKNSQNDYDIVYLETSAEQVKFDDDKTLSNKINEIDELTSNLALKTELHTHTNKTVLDGITSAKVNEWNNKSTFSGNYNDLTNKPTIPNKTSQLANDSGFLTEHQDISSKLDKNFGAENVGKMLVVGSDGNIITMDVPSGATGDVIGTVDESNNILLSGNLAEGTYILKYENGDGTYSDVGNLIIGEIKPSEPEQEPIEGNLFNLETTTVNVRFSTSSYTETTQNGGWLTDFIPVNIETDHTLYVKNAIMKKDVSSSPYPAVNFFDESKTFVGSLKTSSAHSAYATYTELISENYTKIKFDTSHSKGQSWWSSVKYMRIAGIEDDSGKVITKDDIKDVIIKLNEEIESEPEPTTGNFFNLETTKINTRFSGSNASEKAQNGVWLTDLIPLDISTAHTIYVKNAVMIRDVGTPPSPVVSFFNESGSYLGNIQCNSSNGSGYLEYTELLDVNYTKIKLDTSYTINQDWWTNVKYMRIAGVEDENAGVITKEDIADVIITLNTPIEDEDIQEPNPDSPTIIEGNLFNLDAVQLNTRISGTSGSISTQNGAWLTDLIEINITDISSLYVKNAMMRQDGTTTAPSPLLTFHDSNGTMLGCLRCNSSNVSYQKYVEIISENYTKIDFTTTILTGSPWYSDIKYMRVNGVENPNGTAISSKDDIKDVIIKINEPIE